MSAPYLQRTPRINTNDDQVQLVAWRVAPGDYVEAGEEMADVETTKAVVAVEAERSGYLSPLVAVGEIVAVGAPLAWIADSADAVLSVPAAEPAASVAEPALSPPPAPSITPAAGGISLSLQVPAAAAAPTAELGSSRLSPAAQRRAQELGLSGDQLAGRGLLTLRDIEALAARPSPREARGRPIPSGGQPLSLAKRAEAAALQLGAAGGIVSHLTVQFPSSGIRRRLEREGLFDGQPLPLILYELARLLGQWPQLNAWCDGERVYPHPELRIGLALDLGQGLKVVQLPGLERQLPAQIHAQVQEAAQRYLDQRLRPEELEGSSFSVTDLSSLDVLQFRPLINGRQSAILGIGGDSQAPGWPMSLTLAFDHRCSNGREVGLFLQALRERLLAYAEPEPVAAPAADTGASLAAALRGLAGCDLCGIPREAYYRDFGRYAFLHAYVRPDGSLGAACHRCTSGTA
ncbi:MAG: 2-oxo acid dehydrogenase subunit E2 [Inhella sp.]